MPQRDEATTGLERHSRPWSVKAVVPCDRRSFPRSIDFGQCRAVTISGTAAPRTARVTYFSVLSDHHRGFCNTVAPHLATSRYGGRNGLEFEYSGTKSGTLSGKLLILLTCHRLW
jgi:hypothetical protein